MYVRRCLLNQYPIYTYIYWYSSIIWLHMTISMTILCLGRRMVQDLVLQKANCDQVTKKINETSKCQFASEYLWLRVWFFGWPKHLNRCGRVQENPRNYIWNICTSCYGEPWFHLVYQCYTLVPLVWKTVLPRPWPAHQSGYQTPWCAESDSPVQLASSNPNRK